VKPRNPTPSGTPAKSTAPTGNDAPPNKDGTPAEPDGDNDASHLNGEAEENGTEEPAQMEFQAPQRPSNPIRLRPPTRPGGLAGSKLADAEHSGKQYQRTIDELNRRIIALEGTQRERAQELAKEKEVRLKAERQLSAAERALHESAAIIENTRIEAKRELDAEVRKRDTETGRQSKDQQKAVTDLQEEVRRLRDELEAARAQSQTGAGEPASEAAAWEARAIAQFEEDIENYRARIKTLIQERDTLNKEKERLAEALADGGGTPPNGEADPALKTELETLRKQNAALEEKIAALRLDATRAASAAGSHGDGAETARLAEDFERLSNERDLAQEEAEKLMAELDGLRDLRRQDQEKFDRERAANQFNKESGAVSLRKTIDMQQKAIASLTKERDEITRLHEALSAELAEAVTARQQMEHELAELRSEMESASEAAERAIQDLKEHHNAALVGLKQEHERAIATAARQQAEVEADRADLLQQLSASSGHIADLNGRLSDAENQLRQTGEALAKQEESLSDIARDSDRNVRELESKHAEAVSTLRAEKEQLIKEANDFIGQLKAEHASEVAALSRSEGEIIRQKDREIADLRSHVEAVQEQSARQLNDAERASEHALNAVRIQMDQQLADRDRQMTEILNSLAEAREGRQADNQSFSGEFRALMKQRDDALAEVQRTRSEVERLGEELQELKTDATKSSDELRARAEREIVRLQREREQLIKQRDEFRNRVKQLADQQRRLLEEIANDPFRSLGSHRLPEPAPVFIEPISTKHNKAADAIDGETDESADVEEDGAGETILERPESTPKPIASKPNIPLPRARPAAPPPPPVRRAG
jgi:chromosome segregation ATPase